MTKNISRLHLDILDEGRQGLLLDLKPLVKDFVLGGGTALALQIAHRKSFDFDFFSSQEISQKLLESISRVLPVSSILVDTRNELSLYTNSDIKLTFLYYPFGQVFEQAFVIDGIKLFSISEIAVQKAYTIGRRGEYRDYFDLYSILKKRESTLEAIIKRAREVYRSIFEPKIFLQQLVYFDDLLDFTIIPIDRVEVPAVGQVKAFFEEKVAEYIDEK